MTPPPAGRKPEIDTSRVAFSAWLKNALGATAVLAVLFAIFLWLGLMISSPWTRATPDCSVWCVLGQKWDRFMAEDGAEDG